MYRLYAPPEISRIVFKELWSTRKKCQEQNAMIFGHHRFCSDKRTHEIDKIVSFLSNLNTCNIMVKTIGNESTP